MQAIGQEGDEDVRLDAGLETDIRKLCAKGCKPLLIGAGSWLFISAFSLVLVELIYS